MLFSQPSVIGRPVGRSRWPQRGVMPAKVELRSCSAALNLYLTVSHDHPRRIPPPHRADPRRRAAGRLQQAALVRDRENYCSAIARAGGLPLALPHETGARREYLDALDGLVVTGGAFDSTPSCTARTAAPDGQDQGPPDRVRARDPAARSRATAGARHLRRPAAARRRARRHADPAYPRRGAGRLAHEQPNPRTEPGHPVEVWPARLLRRSAAASGSRSTAPTTRRPEVGPGVVINARAPDGVIEGIEAPARASASACNGIRNTASPPLTMRCSTLCRGMSPTMRRVTQLTAGGPERVAKRIARAGLCSRRDAER